MKYLEVWLKSVPAFVDHWMTLILQDYWLIADSIKFPISFYQSLVFLKSIIGSNAANNIMELLRILIRIYWWRNHSSYSIHQKHSCQSGAKIRKLIHHVKVELFATISCDVRFFYQSVISIKHCSKGAMLFAKK